MLSSSFSQNYSSQLFVTYTPYWPVLDGCMPRWVLWAVFTRAHEYEISVTFHQSIAEWRPCTSLYFQEFLLACCVATALNYPVTSPYILSQVMVYHSELYFTGFIQDLVFQGVSDVGLYMTWMNVPMKVNVGSRVGLGLWRPYRKWVTTLLGLSFPWSFLWHFVFLRHHSLIVVFVSLLVYCSITSRRLPG